MPEKDRKWGYYVLPFLLDDRIVARVDLKADRSDSTLLVRSAHAESDIDAGLVAERLVTELRTLSAWLGMNRINVRKHNAFARLLAQQLSASTDL